MESTLQRVWDRVGPEITEVLQATPANVLETRAWTVSKLALASALALAALVLPLVIDLGPVRASGMVGTVGGGLQRVGGNDTHGMHDGEPIAFGDSIHSRIGDAAIVALRDGSKVEIRPDSALSFAEAPDGLRINLDRGSLIVTAAKQGMGHLYVQTKEVLVSVVGTVFLVNAEEAGSRVSVIQGAVHVQHDATATELQRGEQLTTNPLVETFPLREEFAWSSNRATHEAAFEKDSAIQKPLRFQITSLKPDPMPDGLPPNLYIECRGSNGTIGRPTAIQAEGFWTVPQGACIGRHVSLRTLIATAYDVRPLRMPGLPDWASDGREGFQVEATAADKDVTKEQLRDMLRELLRDRFKLTVHREIGEVQGYVLTTAAAGLTLTETRDEELLMFHNSRVEGVRQTTITGNASMKTFAEFLSASPGVIVGRVLDRTGLRGTYVVRLSYRVPSPIPERTGPGNVFSDALAAALDQQMGLRLEAAKVPDVEVVVDHVEPLSEN